MATTKKPKQQKEPKLHLVSAEEANQRIIKVITKSFNTSSIKNVILPKFLVEPRTKHQKQSVIQDKGFIVLIFDSPMIVPNGNLYKDLLDTVKEGKLNGLTIDLYNGLSVWTVEEPTIRSIDFGQLNIEPNIDPELEEEENEMIQKYYESQGLPVPSAAQIKNSQQDEKTEVVMEINYSGITINGTTVWV
jgi:hypothetical protein